MNEFAAVLNCMDGRVQTAAFEYLQTVFGAKNIDTVTAPGMVKHVAAETDRTARILGDLDISLGKHGSTQIGIVAHGDCAGNPVPDAQQRNEVATAIATLRSRFPDTEVVGLFIDAGGTLEPIT